jgi:diacylglycerol kinase family enzyme
VTPTSPATLPSGFVPATSEPPLKVLFITNPRARVLARSRGIREDVARVLEEAFELERVETEGRGHARELAGRAIVDGADVVGLLGGDGTLNEAANALALTDTPLIVLPGGETNIVARALGLSRDPVVAARQVVRRATAKPRRLPLGRAADRYFVANCGIGLDAAIVRRVESHPRLKQSFGDLYFIWNGIRLFFLRGYDRRVPHLEVAWGNENANPAAPTRGQYLAIVQNMSPYTFLGSRAMRVCPDADMDGGLDFLSVDSMEIRTILSIVFSTFGRAGHAGNEHVTLTRDQRSIRVKCDLPMPTQADGEYMGELAEIEIRAVPDGLSILC